MIEVFARRQNAAHAAALVARLAAEGRAARANNSAWFDVAQIDKAVLMVYHDGEDARIPAAYEDLGVPCEIIPGHQPEGGVPKPTEPAEPEPEPEEEAGYSLRQNGQWWSVIGPDGEKVGKSHRTEDAARAALGDVT